MEGAGRNEENVVGVHDAVLGVDGAALDDGQKVALHALARDVGSAGLAVGRGDLVDLVDEDDAHLLGALLGEADYLLVVHQLGGLLLHEQLVGIPDLELAAGALGREGLAEEPLHLVAHVLHAGNGEDVDGRPGGLGDLHLDLAVVDHAQAVLLAQLLAGGLALGGAEGIRQKQVHEAGLGFGFGLLLHRGRLLLAHEADGYLHEVADHGLHVAAHVAHLGELGGLHLDEGGAAQLGQTPGNLGLADAGGAHHDDILRRHLVAQVLGQLLPAPAVAYGNSHHALGLVLADDELVQFRDDFMGFQGAHRTTLCRGLANGRLQKKGRVSSR